MTTALPAMLKREKEAEIAKKLADAREIMLGIITGMPFYKKIEAGIEIGENDDDERSENMFNEGLRILEMLMKRLETADRKISSYGSLNALKRTVREKTEAEADIDELKTLIKEAQAEYGVIESEVGMKIRILRSRWAKIARQMAAITEARAELINHNLRLVVYIA